MQELKDIHAALDTQHTALKKLIADEAVPAAVLGGAVRFVEQAIDEIDDILGHLAEVGEDKESAA